MKTQYRKILASIFIGGVVVISASAVNAQGLQVSCATPIGVFPMPGGIPQPGLPCGNGMNSGVTIVAPGGFPPGMPGAGFPGGGLPSGGFPGGGFPGGGFPGGGFPGGGFPGGMPPGPQGMGLPQIAGALGANREAQLAAECASAGDPRAVGVCIAGRLTTAELQKCSAGIGTPGGCFGPSNSLRIFVENGISDLTRGPGPNNDLVGRNGFTCKKLGICF